MNLREKWEQASKPMWFSVLAPLIGACSSLLGCRFGAAAAAELYVRRSSRSAW
jgi:hypothetical protein